MPESGLLTSKVRSYMESLSPAARALLVRTLRASGRDDLSAEIILKAAEGLELAAETEAASAGGEPWSDRLAGLDVPVRLHHGASDGWTPPDMAEALRRALPRGCEVEILDGLGHYSTAARVLADLAAAQT